MKHLKTFEKFKSTNEEFDFNMTSQQIDQIVKLTPLIFQLFALLALAARNSTISLEEEKEKGPSFAEKFFLKPYRNVVEFFKTSSDKIASSLKDLIGGVENTAEDIEALGMEEEAKRWILDNIVYNKELQDELKSIESNIKTIKGEMSDIDKRRVGASGPKIHHLDQLTLNKQKYLNLYRDKKLELSNKAKAIVDKLQSDNPELYKALMRTMKDYLDKIYTM